MITYLSIILSLYFTNYSNSKKNNYVQDSCNYCGEWSWEKNDEKHDFTIVINQEGEYLIGRHCYITDSGNKMDCSGDQNDISFKIKSLNSEKNTVEFTSFYRGAKGKVELRLQQGKLYWKIIEKPKDIYYIPLEATLTK